MFFSFFILRFLSSQFIDLQLNSNKEMKHLNDFRTTKDYSLFQDASSLPPFFQKNLLNPARVVKALLNDPQANIRVFYYQYLKLCFQIQQCNYQQYIRKIEQIINNESFKFMFYEDDDPEIFNDLQFKQLIMEFFGQLGQAHSTIEGELNKYPIIDTVFIYFFRSILILTGLCEGLDSYIDRKELFEFLGTYFDVEMTTHNLCVKFVEADIFVYEENPMSVYMAYMDYSNQMPRVSHEAISYECSQEVIEAPIPQIAAKPQVTIEPKGKTIIKQSYIEGQFIDYTSNSPTLHSLVKENKMKQSGTYNIDKSIPKIDLNPQKSVKQRQTNIGNTKVESISSNKFVPEQIKKKTDIYNYAATTTFSDYQSDVSSLSQKSVQQAPLNNAVNSFDRTYNNFEKSQNYLELQTTKHHDQFSYASSTYSFNKQPTKDPGFGFKTQLASFNINSFQKQTNYQFNASGYDTSDKKILSNNIILENIMKKPGSYEPQIGSQQIPTYGSSYMPKNPCGLNVSQQFTNSFTMKAMKQPYKSSVEHIREKARNYRNSLKSFIK